MAPLDFRVLGALEVRENGRPIGVTAPKQRLLLSLLLLRANEPVPQDELIEALWDGDAPRTARAAFQNLVHALRLRIGRDVLERTPDGYVLRVEPRRMDAERFRRLTVEARRLPPLERAAKLRQALALWHGTPFPGLAGNPSTHAVVTRLEEERMNALEERIDADLELGEHGALVAELQELVARHPLRERFRAQLMLALYRAGRQADALDSYRRAHGVFMDTLGIEPGVVLRELQRAILVQDSALDDSQRVLGSTLERAAAILPGEPPERAQSLFEYGSALIRIGELRQAVPTLRAAGRLAEAAGDLALGECVRVQLSYLAVFSEGASMGEHLPEAERAASVLEGLGDDVGLAFALSYHAHLLRDIGRAEAALALALRGADLAGAARHSAYEAKCERMAVSCAALGPTPVDRALELCGAITDRRYAEAWDTRAWLLAQAGRIDEARTLYERELDALREQGLVLSLTVGMARAALAERAAGDLGRAADLLWTVYALDRAEDVRGDIPGVAGELAAVLALQGECDEASHLAEESRSLAAPGDVLSDVLWRRAQALVAAREARSEDAVRLADEARVLAARTDWLTFQGETLEDAAYAFRLSSEAARESQALREALIVYERKGNVAGLDRVREMLAGSDPWA